ncbi:hypothetical protein AMS68_002816 [Peltaster fructicola]|uniref:PARP catalytic domain-containing protein n=1 Tax=Peltaster fructicola TaxID=286661 RepID=A0A6H0XRP4_9PEZI|nr:hypothetical protein AMS68_002816 [Peltaster fructicola]
MPRRQFVADLQQTLDGDLPPGIHNLKAGEDDGQIVFSYSGVTANKFFLEPVDITAMIPDVSAYPKSHEYMIFCADDTPKQYVDRIQGLPRTAGKTVSELLGIVADNLSPGTSDASSNASAPSLADGAEFEEDEDDQEEAEDFYMDDDDDFLTGSLGTKQPRQSFGRHARTSVPEEVQSTSVAFRNRVRSDLRAVKAAGYRVSVYGNILAATSCYVITSIRIRKLGLSDEAMLAWQIQPEEYLMLIIHYPSGYRTYEQIQQGSRRKGDASFSMRVFCCAAHKPSLQDTVRAFQVAREEGETDTSEAGNAQGTSYGLRNTFISKPLITLLEEHLTEVLRYRSQGLDWRGAELFYHDLREGVSGKLIVAPSSKHFEKEQFNNALPDIVNNDHFATSTIDNRSFPLLAAQFLLRHFVRCVEFCLVCHCKIESKIEAIKPYVCARPLCLYQYMAMGFGPSIEHEIHSQPWVVDLLVSFCYSAAASGKLEDLPIGLGILVPGLSSCRKDSTGRTAKDYFRPPHMMFPAPQEQSKPAVNSTRYSVGFDRTRLELMFLEKVDGGCPFMRGQWIVLKAGNDMDSNADELHCRIKETSHYPLITIDEPVVLKASTNSLPLPGFKKSSGFMAESTIWSKWNPASFVMYDQEFDNLDHDAQCQAVCRLLDMLPAVGDMASWLARTHHNDLKRWVERIPSATLSLLRWIIASNRACIMQVDGMSAMKDSTGLEVKKAFRQERLYGMQGWVQFRFAMGAPDKEERFMTAVRDTATRLKLQYPTIFAWHGSPIHNWHMIIREGLHFQKVDHGRAYGDGVYHARDANTSIGYSGGHRTDVLGFTSWANSCLKVASAMALNELVNAPAEYRSQSPYYVITQLDWIQTRYLLVKCNAESRDAEEARPQAIHPQDPARTPTGLKDKIVIPASAIKSGRAQLSPRQTVTKKLKGSNGDPIIIDMDEGWETDESTAEDRAILDTEEVDLTSQSTSQNLPLVGNKTLESVDDFEPGTLDHKTLPLMPMPTYATSGTTRRLMNELTSMQKVLASTPPHELGWHIDLEKTDNVYQWIVELHSFDKMEVKGKRLPLADDMAARKIKSVVLEIRFGHDFPYSPPYVRVVRPRFLSFAQGGGGHIVIGGAMCMELLTNTGWSGINTMESVLLQVRLAIASEPFARLDRHQKCDYGTQEAADGFIRACRTHGWTEPPGFREIAYGMGTKKH